MFKHTIERATPELRRLAIKAAGVCDIRLKLSYTPWVNFFVEDPKGSYQRPVRVSGFCDYAVGPYLNVFCRSGRSSTEMTRTIFHECTHIRESIYGVIPLALSEVVAERFALGAPSGSYDDILQALTDEIQEYLECNGNRAAIEKSRHKKAQEKIDNLQFEEMIAKRARYLEDDDAQATADFLLNWGAPKNRVEW